MIHGTSTVIFGVDCFFDGLCDGVDLAVLDEEDGVFLVLFVRNANDEVVIVFVVVHHNMLLLILVLCEKRLH
jgi:hypothetical protein